MEKLPLHQSENQFLLMDSLMPTHFLGGETQCLLCPRQHSPRLNTFLSLEHLLPSLICKKYPLFLSEIEDSYQNHIKLCRPCHDLIDNGKKPNKKSEGRIGKMKIYRTQGILGVTRFLRDYDRTPHKHYMYRQEQQWFELFKSLEEKIPDEVSQLNDDLYLRTQSENNFDVLQSECSEIKKQIKDLTYAWRLVSSSLLSWEKGNFFENNLALA